ncbi:MAG: hypothetical protein A2X08_00510 [Bacteroidetes bacterium GWA2_32_17]|nr:MAG: hypothetical protein A2X08_00510 [Bacteroidetes bacterium GWA2_32_17]
MVDKKPYIETIIEISRSYLKKTFSNKERLVEFLQTVDFLKNKTNRKEIIDKLQIIKKLNYQSEMMVLY